MKQTVSVNYDVKAQAGNCLWYSQEMLNVPHKYDYAWAAYNATTLRHEDQNFPPGVAVPIWFYWKNKLPGDTEPFEYGHAAVVASGAIYSSPLSGVGRSTFNSVDELVRAFGGGIRYVGWSEDISGVKVIEGDNDMVDDALARKLLSLGMFLTQPGLDPDRQPTKEEVENLIGREVDDAVNQLLSYSPYGANWNKVKHYDEDVKIAAEGSGGKLTRETVIKYIEQNLQ